MRRMQATTNAGIRLSRASFPIMKIFLLKENTDCFTALNYIYTSIISHACSKHITSDTYATESETNRTFPVQVRFGSTEFLKSQFEFGSVRFEPTKIVKESCTLAF
jgi:hypothetical protein